MRKDALGCVTAADRKFWSVRRKDTLLRGEPAFVEEHQSSRHAYDTVPLDNVESADQTGS